MRKPTTVTDTFPRGAPPTDVLGLDLGDRRSEVCVLERERVRVRERFALDTTVAAIQPRLAPYQRTTTTLHDRREARSWRNTAQRGASPSTPQHLPSKKSDTIRPCRSAASNA